MKKRSTAIATLVAAASLAGAATVSAHAYPAHEAHFGQMTPVSKVANVRLHALLSTHGTAEHTATIRTSGWGLGAH